MNKLISDLIITTDSRMLYYGNKQKYYDGEWVEIKEPVMAKDLEEPMEAETINSMLFLSKRKHKAFLLDQSFFKKFKD